MFIQCKKNSKEIILPVHRYLDLESHFVESVIHLRYICPNGPLNEQMRIKFKFIYFFFCLFLFLFCYFLPRWSHLLFSIYNFEISLTRRSFLYRYIFLYLFMVYSFVSIRFNEFYFFCILCGFKYWSMKCCLFWHDFS